MTRTPNAIFQISCTTTVGGSVDGHVSLRIEDVASGTPLVDCLIPPDQFWILINGRVGNVRGFISPDLSHVGQYMHTEQTKLPPTSSAGSFRDRDAEREWAEQWAAEHKPAHWETCEVTLHNYGWSMTGHWWDDQPDDRMKWILVDGEQA